MELQQQQRIRRRFSHILASSIGMCRSKHTADSTVPVSRAPVSASLPTRPRNPRLADLFSADSDAISSTTRCGKFDSDKTWSGSDADRASMSHLRPFEYETCEDEPIRRSGGKEKERIETTAFGLTCSPDYYRKSCSSRSRPRHQLRGNASDPRSDSDIASSLLVELSQRGPESSVCSNEPEKNVLVLNSNNNAATRASGEGNKSKPRRRRRRTGKRESSKSGDAVVKGGSMAVWKSSVDPYGDFRRSMVEMIVEKEIFGKEELEELLMRFLTLNSPDHHRIIVLVFVEILQVVFSNSSSSSSTCK
uniref:Transcription repressor n=1 Tax=Kalanchoe fedtschenkoi TaxID=63787 RepID=A0A7N0TAY2_KALFE